MWNRRIEMKLQVKFKTVPVFHWNDQSVLDEHEVMRRVEERRNNIEFHWDIFLWHFDVIDMLMTDSPIADHLAIGRCAAQTHSGNGDKIEVDVTYDVILSDDSTQLSNKLNETSEYLRGLLMYQLPFNDLGLDTSILSNPDENGDEVKVGVTCDPNNTQCTIEIVEE